MEGDSQTHRQHGDLMNLLLFFENEESRLKTMYGFRTLKFEIQEKHTVAVQS
jgi:hypothetical protein